MNVSWMKLTLEEARGFIIDYIITYETLDQRRRRDLRMEVAHPESSYKVIGGLVFTESYSLAISARTIEGEGISSSPIISPGKQGISYSGSIKGSHI